MPASNSEARKRSEERKASERKASTWERYAVPVAMAFQPKRTPCYCDSAFHPNGH